MKLKILLLTFLLAIGRFSAYAQTVVDIIVDSPNHNTLEAAVIEADLAGTLSGDGPFTVFAPTDAAFAGLPDGTVEALLNDIPTLTAILTYHVVGADARSTDLSDGQVIATLNGGEVTVYISGGKIYINNAEVTMEDIVATNGVVHVIDAVLLPSDATSNTVWDVLKNSPDHNTLELAVRSAGLDGTLTDTEGLTLFAPTDAAFAALPNGTLDALLGQPQGLLKQILQYHVAFETFLSTDLNDGLVIFTALQFSETTTVSVTNEGIFVNDIKVTIADLITDNGVVHVIDAVLLPSTPSVMDIVANSPDHSLLTAAVVAAGLGQTLDGEGPFTVFAPTDAAFDALDPGTVEALLNDIPALTAILTYHVVGADARSTDLSDGQVITTLNGADVTVTINANGVFINNVKVTVVDLVADNGVVHVIDAVLLPPAATNTVVDIIVNSPDHNTLEAAVIAADLAGTLSGEGPFTVFAPTDAAFDALEPGTVEALLNDIPALTAILTYHVVGVDARSTDLSDGQVITTLNGADVTVTINADGVFINNAKVTVVDLVASNGVVHVIDAVLLPPAATNTVVDIIVNSPDHNTLEAAVIAADLAGTLSGEGPFTVFAPTDAAFDALEPGTVEALLNDIPALTAILTYHVVGVDARSTDLSDGQVITTLNGGDVTVYISGGKVYINNAEVTVADIVASNGVVHVINAVLLPTDANSNTVWDIVKNSSVHNTLEIAVRTAGLDPALAGNEELTLFAPTDAAFAALPAGVLEAVLADQDLLADILAYHASTDFSVDESLADQIGILYPLMLNEKSTTLSSNGADLFINDVKIIIADIVASNGVVHVIDAVLLAPDSTIIDVVNNSPAHTILAQAIIDAGLDAPLSGFGPFTLFAPTDAAFAALPEDVIDALSDPDVLGQILLYHVVGGTALSSDLSNDQNITTLIGRDVKVTINSDGVFINDAKVTLADIVTDNGVVHVIDAVLLPPTTVADIIFNSPDHNTLSLALLFSGLSNDLVGEGPFTVFAPTDAAFDAIGEDILGELLGDPTGALRDVLLHHVVAGRALSTDLRDGQEITTLLGSNLRVRITSDGVFINNAQVTVADLEASNGVVHVIDAVLEIINATSNPTYDSNLIVYPNPIMSEFEILVDDSKVSTFDVNITNINGEIVKELRSVSNRDKINIASLPTGIYTTMISVNGDRVFRKIVKL